MNIIEILSSKKIDQVCEFLLEMAEGRDVIIEESVRELETHRIKFIKKEKQFNSGLISSEDFDVYSNKTLKDIINIVKNNDLENKIELIKKLDDRYPSSIYIENKVQKFKNDILSFFDGFEDAIHLYGDIYEKTVGSKPKDLSYSKWIREDREAINSENFVIISVGETNVGKSEINNLFIGEDLLGVNKFTETAILTAIKLDKSENQNTALISFYSKNIISILKDELRTTEESSKVFYLKKSVKILKENKKINNLLGSDPVKISITKNDISEAREQLKLFTSAESELHHAVDFVELYCSTTFEANNITLVDAPGLNDLNPLRSIKTKEYLEKSNVILYVVDPSKLISSNLLDNLQYILSNKLGEKLVFLLNKIDLIGGYNYSDEYIREFKKKLLEIEEILLIEPKKRGDNKDGTYITNVLRDTRVFPISAIRTSNAIKKSIHKSPYLRQFNNLIDYLNRLQESDDYFDIRISKFISKYDGQLKKFKEKIISATEIKNILSSEEVLSRIYNLEKQLSEYEERYKVTLDAFVIRLKKKIEILKQSISPSHKRIALDSVKRMIEESDLAGKRSERKSKIKNFIENYLQPELKRLISGYQNDVQVQVENIIRTELEQLKRELGELIAEINEMYPDVNYDSSVPLPDNLGFQEMSSYILSAVGGISIFGNFLIGGMLFSLIPINFAGLLGGLLLTFLGTLTFGIAIIAIGGFFLSKADKMRKEIQEGTRMKSKLKQEVEDKVNEIFEKLNAQLNPGKIADSVKDRIVQEHEIAISIQREPLELAKSQYSVDELIEKFDAVIKSINKLQIRFNGLVNFYSG